MIQFYTLKSTINGNVLYIIKPLVEGVAKKHFRIHDFKRELYVG